MITLKDIQEAKERINKYAYNTPILTSSSINRELDKQIFFKSEHLQKTGSFKVRGALNAALQAGSVKGLIAVSSGNHAQAVAYAAQVINTKALIIMPEDSSPFKLEATKSYDVEVYTDGVNVENREQIAKNMVEKTGYHFIHPFNDNRVMAGQGTQALELMEQVNDFDAVLVAIGGGGLISGISTALKSLKPEIEVIGVEPEAANDAQQSLKADERVPLKVPPQTVADGVRTMILGDKTFPHIQKYVDRIVTVPDETTLKAQRLLMERLKQVIEPTAALAFAPLMMDYGLPKRVAVILSGGNWLPRTAQLDSSPTIL
jgi:threonine dehydratase